MPRKSEHPAPRKPRPPVDTPWLTAEEAAAYVHRSTKTIENWTSDGKIRFSRPVRMPLYHKRDLDAFLESHFVEPVGA
jgi:excisionase family DNA binding protein